MSRASNRIEFLRRHSTLLVCLTILFAILLIGLHGVQRVDPRKIERLIDAQLPQKADETTVVAFLDANHIAHSGYAYHLISAQIGRSTIGLFPGTIYIDFRFDENDKLKTYKLHEVVRTFWF